MFFLTLRSVFYADNIGNKYNFSQEYPYLLLDSDTVSDLQSFEGANSKLSS